MKRILFFMVLMSMTLISCNKSVENAPKPASFPVSEAAYDNQVELFAEFPITESDIVFVCGEELAEGNWAELFGSQSIKNRSISGEGVDGLVYRAASIAYGKPHKVFIQAGFEDLVKGADQKDVYKSIVNACRIIKDISSKTEVYVLSLVNDSASLSAEQVDQFNKMLEKGSKSYKYIDVNSAVKNAEGGLYQKVASALASEIDVTSNTVSAGQSIVMMGGDAMAQIDWAEVIPIAGMKDRTFAGANLLSMGIALTEFAQDKPGKVFITPSHDEIASMDIVKLWDTYKEFIQNFGKTFPNTQLYVLAAIPFGTASANYGNGEFNEKNIEFNKLVSAAQSKYDFLFLDPATVLADESGALKAEYTYDGENLNVDGVFTLATMLLQGPRMMVLNPDALLN